MTTRAFLAPRDRAGAWISAASGNGEQLWAASHRGSPRYLRLRSLASWALDLILTDLQMRVLDGFELLREVRESPRWRDLPMVVVSTLGTEADRKQAARLGADGYLLKSDLRRETLVATVSRFVARPRGPA